MKIRPLIPADLNDLQRMINGLAAHHGDVALPLGPEMLENLVSVTPWFTVLVAEVPDGKVTGYAAMLPTGQLQFGRLGIDIHHLFVEPEARGSGTGRALVQACIRHAKAQGCTYVSVGTHPDNRIVHRFYETHGFARRTGQGPRFGINL
ncbi:N-acetyltransferase family protein [Tateyamaria sp.]|uniref:GNAT family N-acetyltransferase n=1 Tax=Tateyamaria sp. TaxID=1929288 RepID=UPI003B21CE81